MTYILIYKITKTTLTISESLTYVSLPETPKYTNFKKIRYLINYTQAPN